MSDETEATKNPKAEEATDIQKQPAAENGSKGKSKRKVIGIVIGIVVVLIAAAAIWFVGFKIPHDNAVSSFNSAVSGLDQRNADLDQAVEGLDAIVNSGDQPLDSATLDAANSAISEAQDAKVEAPEMPSDTNEINAAAATIEGMGDYATQLAAISTAQADLQTSIKQCKQVTCPTEQFVIQRLTGLPDITGVEAVTETNDPYGQLNKAGGYTALVFFSCDLVNQSNVSPMNGFSGIVAGGCAGGGAVEVYSTVQDANKRNDYLAVFDGSILAPGSHTVLGTCVVRTSDNLTASQEKALGQSIIDSLTRLE